MSDERKDPKADEERPDGVEPPEGPPDEGEGPEGGESPASESGGDSDPDPEEPNEDDDGDEAAPDDAAAGEEPDIEVLGYEALSDAGVSLGGPDEEEESAEDEHDIDLSEFDGAAEEDSALQAELDAARSQTDELRREKAELEEQVAALRDQLRRTAADFENYRKRTERDRREERKQAASGLVLELLGVTDNFRRALDQAESAAAENEALGGFVEGVRLIETQFFDILRAAGLEPVDADGAFDPAVHEALMQEPSTDAPHLSILEVFEPGYLFGGRLLRPARVKVALNPDGAREAEPSGETEPEEEAGEAETSEGEGEGSDGDPPQDSE